MKNLKIFVIALALIGTTAHAELISLPQSDDACPTGYSRVGSPDGQCYELQAPVTIDVNPAGSGVDYVRIDVNPAGSGVSAVQIDVNPFNPGTGAKDVSITATSTAGDITVSTTTPAVITSVEQLQPYIFSPDATNAEKIVAIENHLKSLLMQLIEQLIKQLQELQKAQN